MGCVEAACVPWPDGIADGMSGGTQHSLAGTPAGWILMSSVVVLAAFVQTVNGFLFGWHAGVPLPVSDAWYFLEGFVNKAMSNGLGVSDFFVQRSAGDHAQPFQKLVLLVHLRWADLDFRVEEMVGLAGAALSSILLTWLVWRGADAPARRPAALTAAATVWVVSFSTNATELYTWSLVALGWWMVACAVGFWWLVARVSAPLSAVAFGFLGAGLLGVVWDEVAIPVVAAAVLAKALLDRRQGFAATLGLAGGVVSGIALARVLLALLSGDATAEATGGSVSRLLAMLQQPQAWHAIAGPLADGVVHRSHLDAWAPAAADAWQIAIAVVVGMGHVAFWWKVLASRKMPARPVAITAVAMMLFFYACVAGILLSRAGDFGPLYVHQPRYVLVYQLNLIALALLLLAPTDEGSGVRSERHRLAGMATAFGLLALLAVQYPLARAAWAHAPYLRDYVERSALTMGQLAIDPATLPAGGCSQILTICSAPVETRRTVMRTLADHRLNVFSPAFQARHRLYPDARTAALAAGAPDCSASVLDWGPRQVVRGQGFNVQADGRSAFWIRLAPGARVTGLSESRDPLEFVQGDGALSFQVDQVLAGKIASRKGLEFEASCPQGGSARFRVPIVDPSPAR